MPRRLSHQKALLFVSWISRAMDWGPHNWVWDKAPVSRLKLSKFHQDLNPHLNVIFRPGHGILSRYWNSSFTGTMVKHPHHDNIKWMGLGQWILVLCYLSRTIHCPHPVQSLLEGITILPSTPSAGCDIFSVTEKQLQVTQIVYILIQTRKHCDVLIWTKKNAHVAIKH